ncbi:putative metallopeptidase [Pseudomonas sp. Tn43]|uniref:putative metallopeptidase n=1 Tax=Pseudomonas sp. Tn43 TaxID=701213 RepID=UPI00161B25F6|nr:putative metallopeptidase [Pseudomonas sp. Tn43]
MNRPMPPKGLGLFNEGDDYPISFAPAPEVADWLFSTIIDPDGELHNEDHQHLNDADLAVLWAAGGFTKQGRTVVGQAEQVTFRCGPWQKGRQEQQMTQWFGRVPSYLITLDASYCAQCSDADFCALVEHELYHIAQEHDEYGAPKFTKEGMPKLCMRGHDVEEFVGVVRRYGASPEVQALVDAANSPAEVGKLNISRACGTCLLRLA